MFSVYENESELVITLDVSRPALTEFSVIIVASPDTADGMYIRTYQMIDNFIHLSCACRV